jgi:hypothetical protein
VWTEVERSDHVEGDLAVKPEALEPDRGDFFAGLVEGTNLCSAHIGINRCGENRRGRTDGLCGRSGHVKTGMGVGEEKGTVLRPPVIARLLKRYYGRGGQPAPS